VLSPLAIGGDVAEETRTNKPTPPGEYIREELKVRGWTQADLATILDRPLPTVNEIIQGKRAIMPEMAVALGRAFGTPPETWMNREVEYRLSLVKTDASEVQRRAKLYELAPVKDMIRRGWILPTDDPKELERAILNFFEIDQLGTEPSLVVAWRKSTSGVELSPAQRAWCFRVKQLARAYKVAPFSAERLDKCEADLRKLAAYPQEARKAPATLASYGIRLVIVEPIPGSKVDGITLWLDPGLPVIGLSLRFDRNDSFWHTLGHEFSHIKHGDAISVDNDLADPDRPVPAAQDPIERRADEEAVALLVPPDKLESFIARVGPLYSKERIIQFANRIRMHPGIIVGQLQHRREIGYHSNREMLAKVRETVTSTALTDGWGHSIDPRILQ
jgi:HTH-type transcriptional regulator/antitoxin HigA